MARLVPLVFILFYSFLDSGFAGETQLGGNSQIACSFVFPGNVGLPFELKNLQPSVKSDVIQLSSTGVFLMPFRGTSYVLRLGSEVDDQDVPFEVFGSAFFDFLLPGRHASAQRLSRELRETLLSKIQFTRDRQLLDLSNHLQGGTEISIAQFYEGERKPIGENYVELLAGSNFEMLLNHDSAKLQAAWRALGKTSTFSSLEFFQLSKQSQFDFLAEVLRLKIPHTLLNELAETFVLRLVLGDGDFHWDNWVYLDGHAIGVDLARRKRLGSNAKNLIEVAGDPLNLPWQAVARLYFPVVSDNFLANLKQIDAVFIKHVANLRHYQIKQKEVDEILGRRDFLVRHIEQFK